MNRLRACVFGGASPATRPRHLELAHEVGHALATASIGVVFGGGANGMMGATATGALAAGGAVMGVLPRFLFEREPPHPGVTDLHVVDTMHERKALMYRASHAFIALPGGFGTLEEAMEVITWRQLALHDKPVLFVDRGDFWDGVEATFDRMHADGFLDDRDRALVAFVRSGTDVVDTVTRAARAD